MMRFCRLLAANKRYWLGPVLMLTLAIIGLLLLGRSQSGAGLFQYKLF